MDMEYETGNKSTGLTGFDSKDSGSVSMPGIGIAPVTKHLKTTIGETNYALAA